MLPGRWCQLSPAKQPSSSATRQQHASAVLQAAEVECKAVAHCRAGQVTLVLIMSAATFSLALTVTGKSLQATALLWQAAQVQLPCGVRQVMSAVITLAFTD